MPSRAPSGDHWKPIGWRLPGAGYPKTSSMRMSVSLRRSFRDDAWASSPARPSPTTRRSSTAAICVGGGMGTEGR